MKKGFTLTELLLALAIVGVVAMLTVPVLVSNISKKTFVNQLKNMVANIEQVAQDELITHRTRDLTNTDFANPDKLLSDTHFHIVRKCTSEADSLANCWKTTSTGDDKVTYKKLNGTAYPEYMAGGLGHGKTVILKNGVIMNFNLGTEAEQAQRGGTIAGYMYIDVNGNDKPNVAGRDAFLLWITKDGRVVGSAYVKEQTFSLSELKTKCNSDIYYCYDALLNNSWVMDY